MAAENILKDMESATSKALEAFRVRLSHLRTGRATTALLDPVKVEAYGQTMPLAQMASLSVPEPRCILVSPFDKSQIPAIEKAIIAANLGLNPASQGNVIRVPIPALNEERRKDLAKQVKSIAEEVRVSVRNSRRDANEAMKKAEKEGTSTADEVKKMTATIQKKTDEVVAKIDEMVKKKEAEVMEV
jgi:ribosome recycling factor